MSQIGRLKAYFIIDKNKDSAMFELLNNSLNKKSFIPPENYFNQFKKSNTAKVFFYDLKGYEIPEKVYTSEYTKDKLDDLSELIMSEIANDWQKPFRDRKYTDMDIGLIESVQEPIYWLDKIKYKFLNMFYDVKKSKIKEQILLHKKTCFDSSSGELYINTEFSTNTVNVWIFDLLEFLKENLSDSSYFNIYFDFDYGTNVYILKDGKVEEIYLGGEENEEIYDHNGFYNIWRGKLPENLPFKIDWNKYSDVKMLEDYFKKAINVK